jgi:hypothetical protein
MAHTTYVDSTKNPKPEITLGYLETEVSDCLHMLRIEDITILMEPDRLRYLAAVILDKFPLIAPLPAETMPVDEEVAA